MTLPDPLTGDLALSERGEYYHFERPDECGICDDILVAFRYAWPDASAFRFAWEHVRSCPVAQEKHERGRVQLLAKHDAGELHIPTSWMDETTKMIQADKED